MSSERTLNSRNRVVVPVIIAVVALILIVAVVFLSQGKGAGKAAETPVADAQSETVEENQSTDEAVADVESDPQSADETVVEQPEYDLTFAERRDPNDVTVAGPVDAPVVLVVFSDYQCGYCAKWSQETLPAMMQKADNGELRIEWRDVNIFGPESRRGATAAYAAGLQGKFWEYHDLLYPNGTILKGDALSEDALVALAGELGLDTAKFKEDMYADTTIAAISDNEALGLELGVYSTPSFLMGGTPIVGAQPSEVFDQAFAQALTASKG